MTMFLLCPEKQKAASLPELPFYDHLREKLLLEAVETTTELLNATSGVHDCVLRTRVEGVRFGAHVQLDHWVFFAFKFAIFAARRGRAANKFEAVGHVHEQNFAVIGVNAVFHEFLRCSQPGG
jgi:hypothetical protein